MKKILFSLAFIAATLTSCLTDKPALNYEGKDAVNYTIGINVPELATRAGETDMNSGLGAIDNFSDDEWAKYDLRYMLEVYDVTPGYENLERPIKERMVKTFDSYQETTFELRIIPNRTYKFVVWADIVLQGSEEDLNYNTANLANITRTGEAAAMDECMDAYFIQEDIEINSTLSKSLTLTRPFGKIRVIATDVNEVNFGSTPAKVDVTFYNHPTFVSLNALSGDTETTVEEVTYSYAIAKDAPYTGGYDAEAKNQTLFADYIFAQPQAVGAQEVNFTIAVTGEDNRLIREHDFNTQIPLKRNHLTTIMGNLLTTATEFNVSIDDDFDGETIVEINPDAPQLPTPEVSTEVEGNVVTLSWAAIEGTDYYTVAYDENSAAVAVDATTVARTTETSIEYTLNYATAYTFYVTAYPKDLMANTVSETQVINITTEYDQLVMSKVNAEVVDLKNVVLTWDEVANAASYAIKFNDETYTTEDCTYTFELDYATEYTFAVTAVAEQGNGRYSDSEAVSVTATTEAKPVDPYIYFKPNDSTFNSIIVYTYNRSNSKTPIEMSDKDNDGVFEVEKSLLKNKFYFSGKSGYYTYQTNEFTYAEDVKDDKNLFEVTDTKQNGWWNYTWTGEWKVK